MFLIIISDKLLIQRKIDLMRSDGSFIIFRNIDFMNNLLQRGKILLDRLINKDISICKIEDLPLHATL